MCAKKNEKKRKEKKEKSCINIGKQKETNKIYHKRFVIQSSVNVIKSEEETLNHESKFL